MERKTISKERVVLAFLIALELVGVFLFFLIGFGFVKAAIGQNVTVITRVDIGNSVPEIFNLTISPLVSNSIDLIQNSTKTITVEAIIRDYNGEGDINTSLIRVEFYDGIVSSFGASDDNNNHYTNASCSSDVNYGDLTEINTTCTLEIWYYANNASWNVTFYAEDLGGLQDTSTDQTTVNTLISIGLPDMINYGLVNATKVSDEAIANVTNYGNTKFNLTLEGYAINRSDGLAMNCTFGTVKNISIGYEKYNLTSSNTSILNLTQFESIYTNLTNASVAKRFNLNYRQNDTYNEAVNASYWRIYVPKGVAGNCSGNIIFGAIRGAGT